MRKNIRKNILEFEDNSKTLTDLLFGVLGILGFIVLIITFFISVMDFPRFKTNNEFINQVGNLKTKIMNYTNKIDTLESQKEKLSENLNNLKTISKNYSKKNAMLTIELQENKLKYENQINKLLPHKNTVKQLSEILEIESDDNKSLVTRVSKLARKKNQDSIQKLKEDITEGNFTVSIPYSPQDDEQSVISFIIDELSKDYNKRSNNFNHSTEIKNELLTIAQKIYNEWYDEYQKLKREQEHLEKEKIELKEWQAFYKKEEDNLFNNLKDKYFGISYWGRYKYVAEAMAKYWGESFEQLYGKTQNRILADAEDIYKRIQANRSETIQAINRVASELPNQIIPTVKDLLIDNKEAEAKTIIKNKILSEAKLAFLDMGQNEKEHLNQQVNNIYSNLQNKLKSEKEHVQYIVGTLLPSQLEKEIKKPILEKADLKDKKSIQKAKERIYQQIIDYLWKKLKKEKPQKIYPEVAQQVDKVKDVFFEIAQKDIIPTAGGEGTGVGKGKGPGMYGNKSEGGSGGNKAGGFGSSGVSGAGGRDGDKPVQGGSKPVQGGRPGVGSGTFNIAWDITGYEDENKYRNDYAKIKIKRWEPFQGIDKEFFFDLSSGESMKEALSLCSMEINRKSVALILLGLTKKQAVEFKVKMTTSGCRFPKSIGYRLSKELQRVKHHYPEKVKIKFEENYEGCD